MGPVRSGSCHAVPKCRAPGSDICQLKMGNMSDIPQPGPQENTKKLDIGPWPDPGQRVISLGHTGQDPAPPNPPPPPRLGHQGPQHGEVGPHPEGIRAPTLLWGPQSPGQPGPDSSWPGVFWGQSGVSGPGRASGLANVGVSIAMELRVGPDQTLMWWDVKHAWILFGNTRKR